MSNIRDNNGDYRFLPKIFRDFHDQKDLFKDIYNEVDFKALDRPESYDIPWTVMHVNSIDIFLFQMARRGYTLQRDDRFKTYENPIKNNADDSVEIFKDN